VSPGGFTAFLGNEIYTYLSAAEENAYGEQQILLASMLAYASGSDPLVTAGRFHRSNGVSRTEPFSKTSATLKISCLNYYDRHPWTI
jgi:hypothetical protein